MDAPPDSTTNAGPPHEPYGETAPDRGLAAANVGVSQGVADPLPSLPADGDFAALSPKVLTLWRWVWGAVGAAVTVIAALIGVVAVDLPVAARVAIPVVVGIIAAVLVIRVPAAAFKRWRYRVTDDGLDIDHGLIVHQKSSIPHFRVQHVDIRRGLIQRQLGIVSITISTASPATDAQLPGLDPDQAEAIRRRVLDRAEADDGV